MRFFSAADRAQPTLLGYLRKGGVQRSEAFGVLIDDACHGRGPRMRFELENGRLAETRSSQRAVPNSIWSKIRPAGSYVQRNIQRSSGAPLTQLPLCNSPLLPPAACNHRRRIRSGAQRPPIWARSAAVPRVETGCLRKISFTWSPDLGRRFQRSRYPAVSALGETDMRQRSYRSCFGMWANNV